MHRHAQLVSVEDLDENFHILLRRVPDDIEEVAGDEAVEAPSVRAELKDAAVKFEADHPRLAGILAAGGHGKQTGHLARPRLGVPPDSLRIQYIRGFRDGTWD